MKATLLAIAATAAVMLTVASATMLFSGPPEYVPPPTTNQAGGNPHPPIPPGWHAHPEIDSADGVNPGPGPNGTWRPEPYDWFGRQGINDPNWTGPAADPL